MFGLLVLGFTLFTPEGFAQIRTNIANGVVAKVNEAIITRQQVEDYMREFLPPILRQYRNEPEVLQKKVLQLQAEGLEQLIDRRLVIDEFKTSGGLIPDRFIEDDIRNRVRDRFGDRISLTRELQAKGMTFEDYRTRVREEIVSDFMRRRNLSTEKILISPRKIQVYYETNKTEFAVGEAVRLRILTLNKTAGEDSAAKKKLGEEIVSKLKSGATFVEMANTYSEDSFAKEGGDRKEFLETSTLREEFRDPSSKLPLKQPSGLIETPDGFYVLQVEERKEAHNRPLAEARDEIEKTLVLQERNRLQKNWLKRLRDKAFINYF